jgi:hypothetical protein
MDNIRWSEADLGEQRRRVALIYLPKGAQGWPRSRLEEGGGARNRIDTLACVATALDRHLVVSFPEKVPAKLTDAVQVA